MFLTISSISAPWLQVVMLEQAGLRGGLRILEIGSGGYNAALLAELVGGDFGSMGPNDAVSAFCGAVDTGTRYRFSAIGASDTGWGWSGSWDFGI